MENKTSKIIMMNVVILLLYLKFGSLFFWFIAVSGFSIIVFITFTTLVLQIFFIEFYESKFCPCIKKITGIDITGRDINLPIITSQQKKDIKKGIISLIVVMILLCLLFLSPFIQFF